MKNARPQLVRSDSLHQQVARTIRNEIEAGILRDGDVLPSTRELAAHWGVSVFTVAEAMKLLVQENLIITKARSKRIVHAPTAAPRPRMRSQAPRVLLIGGYAGSGKTHLGRILARETGWPLLDKDTLTRPVVEAALEALGSSPHDRESDTYLQVVRPREYEALMAAVDENVTCGASVIVTAPFLREFADRAWLDRLHADQAASDVSTTLIWVHCDAETMQTYIRHRGAARDAGKLTGWTHYVNGVDLEFRPAAPHIVIDNRPSAAPLQKQARDVINGLFAGRAT